MHYYDVDNLGNDELWNYWRMPWEFCINCDKANFKFAREIIFLNVFVRFFIIIPKICAVYKRLTACFYKNIQIVKENVLKHWYTTVLEEQPVNKEYYLTQLKCLRQKIRQYQEEIIPRFYAMIILHQIYNQKRYKYHGSKVLTRFSHVWCFPISAN